MGYNSPQFPLDNLVWSGQTIVSKEDKMHITNISEAKAHLSSLIEKVKTGQEIIIGKAGKPVAKLVPYERNQETRRPGALRGKIKIAKDFDELPDEIAEAFGIIDS
jgi:prevent-host-death family protein